MAIPHRTQMQIIKRRLIGKTGKARINEIRKIQSELPGFNTGGYGEIKKWLRQEIENTKTKSKITHQDWLGVKRQGLRQFVLVGLPSVGKSSLVKRLSGIQVKVAGYEFTTLKPQPAVVKINSAEIQIVDLPGLIKGAVDDIGGGRRLLGIVKNSDGVILMHDLTQPVSRVDVMVEELGKAAVDKPMLVLASKADLSTDGLDELKKRFSNRVIAVSTETGLGLDEFSSELWKMCRLIRVYPKGNDQPLVLDSGSTVKAFAERIHRDISYRFATVTGRSAKFPNQRVNAKHVLMDEDVVELKR